MSKTVAHKGKSSLFRIVGPAMKSRSCGYTFIFNTKLPLLCSYVYLKYTIMLNILPNHQENNGTFKFRSFLNFILRWYENVNIFKFISLSYDQIYIGLLP